MIALDTSALIKRYIGEPHSDWLVKTMDRENEWCASMLLACEAPIVVARNVETVDELAAVDRRLHEDLDQFLLVPVDGDCLVNAVAIARAFTLRTLDAVHLAALRSLPGDCRFITFDRGQATAAQELGIGTLVPPGL
jgi:predicted nucleic acid-binding protein